MSGPVPTQVLRGCVRGHARRSTPASRRRFSQSPRSASAVAGAAEAEVQAAQKYCADLVLKYDRPAYTLSTFVPRPVQPFYLALRALNVSLSMIPDTTSSHTIGLMRLQFWRDAVTKALAGTPPKEPVAVCLAAAIADRHEQTQGRARISKRWLTRMIDAREQTLTNDPYPDLAALETYAENTYSTLMYLTLSALPLTSVTADHVASHIGKATGIVAILKGLPLVAFPPPAPRSPQGGGGAGTTKQGAVMLPLDIMAQTGVQEEAVFRQGADARGLRDAVFTVATRASDHLITVDQMLANLRAGQDVGHAFEHEGEEGHDHPAAPGGGADSAPLQEVNRAFGVYMPAVATRLWLDRLQQVDFDIFQPDLLRSDWRLPWKAYWAFQRRKL
ncbi:Squalene/phytoene synthase [Aspergillus taichungensis]|uniref:Squalene/phytoene synthase n=1 Tax=Aspergillus taichungensis TaxID=482145 RepID=A0A2J5HNR6_9EURO|nr:Squalene/phytoene synthase [Aspergillus taichungensis]